MYNKNDKHFLELRLMSARLFYFTDLKKYCKKIAQYFTFINNNSRIKNLMETEVI